MKFRNLYWLTIFITFMNPLQEAISAESAIVKEPCEIGANHSLQQQDQVLAHKMMGHISLAIFAFKLDIANDGASHVKKAKGIQLNLEYRAPSLELNSSYHCGKVTYDDVHPIKYHYIPVADDYFIINDAKQVIERAKEVGLSEINVKAVHLRFKDNMSDVTTALNSSIRSIELSDYKMALRALEEIFDEGIIAESEPQSSSQLLCENITLAESFLTYHEYDRARLTLKHLQLQLENSLFDTESPFVSIHSNKSLSLSAALTELQSELQKGDSVLIEGIRHQLKKILQPFSSSEINK